MLQLLPSPISLGLHTALAQSCNVHITCCLVSVGREMPAGLMRGGHMPPEEKRDMSDALGGEGFGVSMS